MDDESIADDERDETHFWIDCPGCGYGGKIGLPLNYPADVVVCPNCRHVVRVRPEDRVLWEPTDPVEFLRRRFPRVDWDAVDGDASNEPPVATAQATSGREPCGDDAFPALRTSKPAARRKRKPRRDSGVSALDNHFVQAALMLAGFVVPLTITLLLGRALGITQHGQQVATATHPTGATSSTAGSENTVPEQAPDDAGKPVPPAAATSDSQAADEAAARESPPTPAESAPRDNSPAPPAPAPPAADDAQRFLALYDGAAKLAEGGDKEHARAMLIPIAAMPAPNAECLMCRGKAHAFLGDFPRALNDAATAIALSPHDARTWHTRAMIFAEAGKLGQAVKDIEFAVILARSGRYEPQYVKEVTDYAGILSVRAKDRSAESADGGSKRQPDSPAARHYRAGIAQFKQGAFAEAVREFTRAIRSKPDSAASYHWRAVALIEVQQFGSALADMNRSLSLRPASPVALHARAVVFEHLGQYRQAYADIIEALRLSPGNLDYISYLARLRAKSKAATWRTASGEERVRSRYGVSTLNLNAGLADAGL